MTKTTLVLPPPTCAPALLNANATEKRLYWDRSHYSKPVSSHYPEILYLKFSDVKYILNTFIYIIIYIMYPILSTL